MDLCDMKMKLFDSANAKILAKMLKLFIANISQSPEAAEYTEYSTESKILPQRVF